MYGAADIVYEEGDGGIDGEGNCKGNGGAHSPPVPKSVPKKAQVCKHLRRFKVRKQLEKAYQLGKTCEATNQKDKIAKDIKDPGAGVYKIML